MFYVDLTNPFQPQIVEITEDDEGMLLTYFTIAGTAYHSREATGYELDRVRDKIRNGDCLPIPSVARLLGEYAELVVTDMEERGWSVGDAIKTLQRQIDELERMR